MLVANRYSPDRIFQTAGKAFFAAVYFFYLTCVIFVGDYYVANYSIYAFWLVSLSGILFWFPLKRETAAGFVICLPLAILVTFGVFTKNIEAGYFSAPLFMLVSILALNRFRSVIADRQLIVYWMSGVALTLFFLFVLLVNSGSSRTSLIFGPTILYRIILFFYAICIIFSIHGRRRLLAVVFTCMAFYSVLKIGSRGGIVALFFIWLLITRRFFSWKYVVFSAIALLIAYLMSDVDGILSSRAFYFSSDSESSNIRLDKLAMVQNFLQGGEILGGMTNPNSLVGNYPHNILAEFLIFHGIFAFLGILFLVLFLVKVFLKEAGRRDWMYDSLIVFSPIFVGSLFSGSLLDNYFFVSAACYLMGLGLVRSGNRMAKNEIFSTNGKAAP